MGEHPNAAVVRRMTEAMQSGEPRAMSESLDENIEWHEIGRSEPVVGLTALGERYASSGPGDYEFDGSVHDVIGGDEHTVALMDVIVTKKSSGEKLNYRVAEIYHIKDGKITARWAMSDDTERINTFFSDWPA